jgi:hypothetical protein
MGDGEDGCFSNLDSDARWSNSQGDGWDKIQNHGVDEGLDFVGLGDCGVVMRPVFPP